MSGAYGVITNCEVIGFREQFWNVKMIKKYKYKVQRNFGTDTAKTVLKVSYGFRNETSPNQRPGVIERTACNDRDTHLNRYLQNRAISFIQRGDVFNYYSGGSSGKEIKIWGTPLGLGLKLKVTANSEISKAFI